MKRRAGFTLLEMVIVVAIIGILMTMLIPAFKYGRELSWEQGCKSNLRQIGSAWLTVAAEEGGYIRSGIARANEDPRLPFAYEERWVSTSERDSDKVWYCPADKMLYKRREYRELHDAGLNSPYGSLNIYKSYTFLEQPDFENTSAGSDLGGAPYAMSLIPDPSQRLMIGDANGGYNRIWRMGLNRPSNCIMFRHFRHSDFDKMEYLKMDGSLLDDDEGTSQSAANKAYLEYWFSHPKVFDKAKLCAVYYDGHVDSLTFKDWYQQWNRRHEEWDVSGVPAVDTNNFYSN